MSNPNALTYENVAVVAVIDPDANAATTYDTDEIDMSKFESIMCIVMAGTLGSSATINFKLQAATTSGGSFGDISGKSITPLTDAGSDSDKQAIVNLRGEEMDEDDRYVKGVLTVGTATSDCSVIVLGLNPRYGPASDNDLASVDELVA